LGRRSLPKISLSRWLWRLSRHNQREQEILVRLRLPKPHYRV